LVTAGGFEDHQASPRRRQHVDELPEAVVIVGDGEVTFGRQETHVERVLGDVDSYVGVGSNQLTPKRAELLNHVI
jgi:hypothetical protein